jgi:hypothetical protein
MRRATRTCGKHSLERRGWGRAVNEMDGPRRDQTIVTAICINTCVPDRLSNLHKHFFVVCVYRYRISNLHKHVYGRTPTKT